MNWAEKTFLLFPAVSAFLLVIAARSWWLAVGGIALALFAVLVASAVPLGPWKRLIPLATGAGIAGIALIPLLRFRPQTGPASRAAMATAVSGAVHSSYLTIAMAYR